MSWLSDDALNHLKQTAAEPDLSATKYTLLKCIGRGGMASVYLAHDRDLDREVALKVLDLPDEAGELRNRMLREAHVVARLEHPGIVPIHDVAVLPDGRVFYAMKHVKGETLVSFRKKSLQERLRVFEKICEAVAFAHSQGVIHRDLKPENIMVGGFGEVLVMDWGLAKCLRGAEESNGQSPASRGQANNVFETDHGKILGTPAYMAPEQAEGRLDALDQRTDVYALGAILYFLLTGEPPEQTHAARKRDKSITRRLEAICLQAMAQSQEDRYANAEELRNDILRYQDGLSVSAYRENVFEIARRWLAKNYFFVLLILSYLFMRALLLLYSSR